MARRAHRAEQPEPRSAGVPPKPGPKKVLPNDPDPAEMTAAATADEADAVQAVDQPATSQKGRTR